MEPIYRNGSRLRAVARGSGLLIIGRLSRGECTVARLQKLAGSDQSTVSRHLATLWGC